MNSNISYGVRFSGARSIDYSLSNWSALTRYLDDGNVPMDDNAVENSIRPLAVGRKNWLFVGSQQVGARAAVMLSLIESAKLNGYDPWAYLKEVFERLPTLKNRDLELLLPHNWRSASTNAAPDATALVPATVELIAAKLHSCHRRFKVGSPNAYRRPERRGDQRQRRSAPRWLTEV